MSLCSSCTQKNTMECGKSICKFLCMKISHCCLACLVPLILTVIVAIQSPDTRAAIEINASQIALIIILVILPRGYLVSKTTFEHIVERPGLRKKEFAKKNDKSCQGKIRRLPFFCLPCLVYAVGVISLTFLEYQKLNELLKYAPDIKFLLVCAMMSPTALMAIDLLMIWFIETVLKNKSKKQEEQEEKKKQRVTKL